MKSIALDNTDLDILKLIQGNAWLSDDVIGETIKVKRSTVSSRILRLKALSVITGSKTIINHNKIRSGLVVFINVSVDLQTTDGLFKFQEEITKYPEVYECYHTTGIYNYLLKIVVDDMQAYNDFIGKKLCLLTSVSAFQYHMAINEVKREVDYPIANMI